MRLLRSLLPALLWALAALNTAPHALADGDKTGGALQPAPAENGSVMFVMATVEGTRLELRQTRTAEGVDLYDARPVIEHLRGRISLEETVITVLRYQDGARLSIDMADGKVTANGQVLGLIPDWKSREAADTWLDANAIAILTGTSVSAAEDGTITFDLDDRLRPQFDLELWVDGRPVGVGEVEPRTIGPVLLLPLQDIVDALGHTLEIDEETGLVTVIRIQDTARITIDPNTGGVAVNNRFAGVSPNMSYAEPENLLFPAAAVETLTGTHITLKPGSNRVEVVLDARLGGGVLPDAYVLDEARETPFTFERLDYELASEGPQTLAGYAHAGTFNGRAVLTTAGGLADPAALQPSTITIDLQSLRGWRASLGDVNTPFRELSGAGPGRVRGVSWQRQSEDGDIVAVTAGAPLSGSRRVSETASVPEFSGFAAGARLIRPDRLEEVGVSALSDGGESRIVASAQKRVEPARARDKAGLQSVQASLDLGAFQGGGANAVDVDAQASGAYRLSERTRLRAQAGYRGGSFLSRRSPAAREEETNETMESVSDTESARTNARLSLDWRATEDWTILKDVGAAARLNMTQSGSGQDVQTVGLSLGGRIPHGGPNVTADLSQSAIETADGQSVTAQAASLRVFKRFGWGDTQLVYQAVSQSDAANTSRLVATVTGQPVTRFLGKGAIVSLAPTASFVASGNQSGGRLGAALSGDSGSALGDRLRLGGQVTAAQSFNPDESATELFANLSASYHVNRYIQLSGTVGQSLSGDTSAFLALRGSAPFNPPRKHTLPRDGRGVLKGRAFLDRNRDGIRQSGEPGIPGIVVKLAHTRIRLGADRDGFFTVQNLKAGLYTVGLDRRSLPLGVMVPEDTILRATVGAGQITHIDIPVIASGQLRGAVYVDANGTGAPDAGDARLEGARVTLTPLDEDGAPPLRQYAASFGQFAFESLAPGRYRLDAEHGGARQSTVITLREDNLLRVEDIAFPPAVQVPDALPGSADGVVLGVAP